jgi:hypothetical protein
MKLLEISNVGFDVTNQLLIRFFLQSSDIGERKLELSETVRELFVDLKKPYDSVRREVLYNVRIEFGVPMKLVKQIKMCLNETYNEIHIGKHLSDSFSI